MSDEARQPRNIIFVDDDPAYLELLSQVLVAISKGEWRVHAVSNAGKALALLQEIHVSLVVVDANMPVVDGRQLLRLIHLKHPAMHTAVLTGYGDDATRSEFLALGADLVLEKPHSSDGMENLFVTLNELARVEQEEGFQGVLRRVGLPDVLQMECLSRNSSILEVFTKAVRGQIFIKGGVVVHAGCGELKGPPAFFRLFALKGGQFRIGPFVEPPEITVFNSWEFLVMEAARLRDEGPEPGSDTTIMRRDATVAGGTNAAPPEQPALPKIQLTAAEKEPLPVRSDGLLICNPAGEVRHDTGCVDVAQRRALLQFVTEQGRRFGTGLRFGQLELVEINEAGSRTVVHLQPESGMVVRVKVPA